MGFNIDRTTLDNLYRPLIFSIGIVFIIFIFSFLITRKSYLAAGVTLILLLPFFSYGHVFSFLANFHPLGIKLSRTSLLLPLYVLLVSLAITLIIRNSSAMRSINPYLNIFALVLIIFPAYQISSFLIGRAEPVKKGLSNRNGLTLEILAEDVLKRDIYIIILDGYNRDDTF